MRERPAHSFDVVWIDNCNGDKYKTGKRTPDGRPDESMFTTDEHPIGIQVGTAIATFVKSGKPRKSETVARVFYRDFWGTGNAKRSLLVKSLVSKARGVPNYEPVIPRGTMRWVFVNGDLGLATEYESWLRLAEIFPTHFSGLNENRRGALISAAPAVLEKRMRKYFDPKVSHDEILELCPPLMTNAARFNARETRDLLIKTGEKFGSQFLVRLAFRPFDDLWVYWVGRTKLLNGQRTGKTQVEQTQQIFASVLHTSGVLPFQDLL